MIHCDPFLQIFLLVELYFIFFYFFFRSNQTSPLLIDSIEFIQNSGTSFCVHNHVHNPWLTDYGVLAFGLSKTLLNFPKDVEGKLMSKEGKKVWMEYVRRKTSTRGNDVVHIVQQQQHSGHGRHYCNQCGKGTCVCFFFSCF